MFRAAAGKRARRFCGAAPGNAVETLERIFSQNADAIFFLRAGRLRKWLPKSGFKINSLKLAPKDATYDGADGFATWLRTTWIPYVQRVPENLREEFIAMVTKRYVAKHPPDAERKVHVKMVRLEIDAVKNLIFITSSLVGATLFFSNSSCHFYHMMKMKFKEISGSVVAPKGFLASGVFCDIKKLGTGKGSNKGPKRDLALIVSEAPATVAGMFTTNQICAAPVKVCVAHIEKGNGAGRSSPIPEMPMPAPANRAWRDAKAMAEFAGARSNSPQTSSCRLDRPHRRDDADGECRARHF